MERARRAGQKLHRFKRTAQLPRVRAVIGVLRGFGVGQLVDLGSAHIEYGEAAAAEQPARNRARRDPVPAGMLAQMHDRWTVPDLTEGARGSLAGRSRPLPVSRTARKPGLTGYLRYCDRREKVAPARWQVS